MESFWTHQTTTRKSIELMANWDTREAAMIIEEILNEFLTPQLWKNLVMSFFYSLSWRNCLTVSKAVLEQTRDICRTKIAKTRWHSPYTSKGTQKWNCYWLMYNLLLSFHKKRNVKKVTFFFFSKASRMSPGIHSAVNLSLYWANWNILRKKSVVMGNTYEVRRRCQLSFFCRRKTYLTNPLLFFEELVNLQLRWSCYSTISVCLPNGITLTDLL